METAQHLGEPVERADFGGNVEGPDHPRIAFEPLPARIVEIAPEQRAVGPQRAFVATVEALFGEQPGFLKAAKPDVVADRPAGHFPIGREWQAIEQHLGLRRLAKLGQADCLDPVEFLAGAERAARLGNCGEGGLIVARFHQHLEAGLPQGPGLRVERQCLPDAGVERGAGSDLGSKPGQGKMPFKPAGAVGKQGTELVAGGFALALGEQGSRAAKCYTTVRGCEQAGPIEQGERRKSGFHRGAGLAVRDRRILRGEACCSVERLVRAGTVLQFAPGEAEELPEAGIVGPAGDFAGEARLDLGSIALVERCLSGAQQRDRIIRWGLGESGESGLARGHDCGLSLPCRSGQKQSGGLPQEPATLFAG